MVNWEIFFGEKFTLKYEPIAVVKENQEEANYMDCMDLKVMTTLLTSKWERDILTIICKEPSDPSTVIKPAL